MTGYAATSDPPGGIPVTPDPDTQPHQTPTPAAPKPGVNLPVNQPPLQPPQREAHHKAK